MSAPRKKSSREVWEAFMAPPVISDAEADAEADRIAALSEEQLDAELRAYGMDPKEVADQGRGLARQLARRGGNGAQAARAPVPLQGRGWLRTHLVFVAVAAAGLPLAALGTVGVVAYVNRDTQEQLVAHPKPEALRLRDEAKEACAREDWVGCERKLDEARGLDPEGEKAPDVGMLRQILAAKLPEQRKGP